MRYRSLRYGVLGPYDEAALMREFDRVLAGVFADLAERLGGRKAVIPLSGGLDSRTVAAMLKRVGYGNVVCFSYGRAGNAEETPMSKRVAEGLGFEWRYVKYSGKTWSSLIDSPDWGRFLDFACRGKSIACLQPLPAMLELVRSGAVPESSVVVPGHALDFEAGSHLPYMSQAETWTRADLCERMRKDHYNLREEPSGTQRLREQAERWPAEMGRDEVSRIYMEWEWNNRQSRFIANDVRAYEYAGCGFELPFWDGRVTDFLSRVPYEGLYGRRLQKAFTAAVVDPACGIECDYPVPAKPNRLKGLAKKALPQLAERYRADRARKARASRVLADYDWMSADEIRAFEAVYGLGFNMNSLVADGTLQRVCAGETAFGD